jgi:mannose-6-phosphate isomerase
VRDLPGLRVGTAEVAWAPSVPDFRLGRVRIPDAEPVDLHPGPDGPQVLLCTAGPVSLTCGTTTVALPAGGSAFLGAGAGRLTAAGPGELFRATVGS